MPLDQPTDAAASTPRTAVPGTPIRYSPSLEQPAEDEAQTEAELVETLISISRKTREDSGVGLRAVHAKAHGILKGTLHIPPNLPPELGQGIFKPGKTYQAVIRFSTTPGDVLDDKVSTPRGMAIKLSDVPGQRLPGAEGHTDQDFVLVNGPAFNAPDPKAFLSSLKLLAKTTDRAPGLKQAASTALQGVEAVLEAFGAQSAKVVTLGGHPQTHLLGETFFSQVPLRFGDYVAKVCVAPVSEGLRALTDKDVDLSNTPDGLRRAIRAFFSTQPAEWELRVQLCTDLATMPIEDASVVWPEDDSPYIPIARLRCDPQDAWDPSMEESVDKRMAFSPWHGVVEHQPLGGVMRVRQRAYQASATERGASSGCPFGHGR